MIDIPAQEKERIEGIRYLRYDGDMVLGMMVGRRIELLFAPIIKLMEF